MLDKFKNVCLIDNKIIENKNGLAIPNLSKYLTNYHNVKLKDYLIKYYYDGIVPKCKCGCGNEASYNKGKFGKYFGDHKRYSTYDSVTIEKFRSSMKDKYTLEYRIKLNKLTKEDLIFYYQQFIDFNINFSDLTKKIKKDKRTLKKLWYDMGLITDKSNFENICKKHQHIWQNKNNKAGGKKHISDDDLLNIYLFLKENNGKFTLNEICDKFSLPITSLVLFKRLSENFGELVIKEYLRTNNSSKKEIEYYNVLRYYFGKDIVKGFKLEGKYYDFILLDKILIEYDGDYWHNLLKNKENDEQKNEIAKKNKYILIRIKESESKDINILTKIKKLYEAEIKRNKKRNL